MLLGSLTAHPPLMQVERKEQHAYSSWKAGFDVACSRWTRSPAAWNLCASTDQGPLSTLAMRGVYTARASTAHISDLRRTKQSAHARTHDPGIGSSRLKHLVIVAIIFGLVFLLLHLIHVPPGTIFSKFKSFLILEVPSFSQWHPDFAQGVETPHVLVHD